MSRIAICPLFVALFVLEVSPGFSQTPSNLFAYSEVFSSPGVFTALAADSAGNSYLAGTVSSSAFPVTPGVVQPHFGGGVCLGVGPFTPSSPCQDAFVMKVDSQGRVVFATYLGGAGPDYATSIAVDAQGDVYVAGNTGVGLSGSAFPVTSGAAFSSLGNSGSGGFVAKLSPDGARLLYSTVLPGLPAAALAIDPAGNAYVAGNVFSSVPFAVPAGGFQSSFHASLGTQPFIAKLNATGSAVLYGTYLGGSNSDLVAALSVDASGNVYLAGAANSTDFPITPGSLQTNSASPDGFLTKLNSAGSDLIYSTYLGGSGSDSITSLAIDAIGNAYVAGQTTSTDFPVTSGALASAGPQAAWTPHGFGTAGGFAAAIAPAGNKFLYSTYLSGVASVTADSSGNAYFAGSAAQGFPIASGAAQGCFSGTMDVFLAELSPSGALLQSSYLGGAGSDSPVQIAYSGGDVIVTGNTSSYDFPRVPAVTRGYIVSAPFLARLRISEPASPAGPCTTLVIQNAGSYFEGPLAPGELISLYGPGIGPAQAAGEQIDASGNIARQLDGVQVMFDETAAPLLYAQDRQVNAIVPFEVYGKTTTHVQVVYRGQTVRSGNWEVVNTFPGVFSPFFYVGAPPGSQFPEAAEGSVLSIWGTGLGQTSPEGVTGQIAKGVLGSPLAPVTVQIGGVNADILYAGDAPGLPRGMFQLNVRVPENVPPETPVTCGVTLTIQAGDAKINQPTQVCVNFAQ